MKEFNCKRRDIKLTSNDECTDRCTLYNDCDYRKPFPLSKGIATAILSIFLIGGSLFVGGIVFIFWVIGLFN